MKFFFTVTFFLLLQIVGLGQAIPDSAALYKAKIRMQYDSAKTELVKYEKAHGQFIQTQNTRMHFLTWGSTKGVPLLWVPGTHSNAYEMLVFEEYFVKAGYYLISIDYYGQGLTPFPTKEVSVYNVADDMKCIMDSLHIKKAIIGGWSRGGSISTAFYDSYPQNTLGLILEDGGSVAWDVNIHKKEVKDIEEQINEEYKRHEREQLFESEFEAYFSRNTSQPWLKPYTLNSIKQNKEGKWGFNLGIAEYVSEATAQQNLKQILRPIDADLYGASIHTLQPKIIYRNLNVPMLIIDPVIKDDEYDFEKENANLQKLHPDFIEHKVYGNTHHFAKFEQAGKFLDDIEAFIKKIKALYNLK